MAASSRAAARLSTARSSPHIGGNEDDMATDTRSDARNPSHAGWVAGGLWWQQALDLAGWEGSMEQRDLGLCLALAGFAGHHLMQPPQVAQRGAA